MYSPSDIAHELGIDPKRLRDFIRGHDDLKRPATQKGQRYHYSYDEKENIKRLYRARYG